MKDDIKDDIKDGIKKFQPSMEESTMLLCWLSVKEDMTSLTGHVLKSTICQ